MSFVAQVWMELPEAEAKVAFQEYLDARFKESPGKVETVHWDSGSQVFRVRMVPREEKQ